MNAEQISIVIIRVVALVIFLFTLMLATLSVGITLLVVPEDFAYHDSYFVVANWGVEAAVAVAVSILLFFASKPLAKFVSRGI